VEPIEPVRHKHEFNRNCSLSFVSTCCATLCIESLASLPVAIPMYLNTYIHFISTYKLSLLFLLRLALGFINTSTLLLCLLNDQWLCSWHESTGHVREPTRAVIVRWFTNCYSIVHCKHSEKGHMVLCT
jgi:hypothetical protein